MGIGWRDDDHQVDEPPARLTREERESLIWILAALLLVLTAGWWEPLIPW